LLFTFVVLFLEAGASNEPCNEIYCGPEAFSEVEVKGVADYLSSLGNVKAFIDVHAYSQLWMFPYGYTKKKPKDYKTLVSPQYYPLKINI